MLIATYNILADAYINRGWYPLVPGELLDPALRHPALIAHIAALSADAICLQEVEEGPYGALDSALGALGYVGTYAKKGQGRKDGCATFVRTSCFAPLVAETLYYADGGGEKDSGHVALLLPLVDRETGGELLLTNTHLRWEPQTTPVSEKRSLRQLRQLVALFEKEQRPIVVCGDFNLRPEDPGLDLLKNAGFVDAHQHQGPGPSSHRTCYANGTTKAVDYLFCSRGLVAKGLGPAPLSDDMPLPSRTEPSDHLALLAQVHFATQSTTVAKSRAASASDKTSGR